MTKNNETKVELTISGMPEESVKLILEFDHQVQLSNRYYEEAKDYAMESMKGSIDFKDDPIDCIADRGPDVHELAFPEPRKKDSRIAELEKAMEELTDQQRDLINDLFGACRSMEDVAKKRGVTRQAIYGQKMRIIEKLRKLMTE